MPNTTGLAVKVGIFVTVGLVLLIGFSLRVTEELNGKQLYSVSAYFENAVGIELGSRVLLGGLEIGDVKDIEFDGTRRKVRVELSILQEYKLPVDSVARIERSAFLGNAQVVIKYGTERTMLSLGDEILAKDVPGLGEMMERVADMSEDAQSLIKDLQDNQNAVMGKIEGVIEENREDIREASRSLADAGPKVDRLAEQLNQITEDVRAGKGTMGKLFTDEELYTDLKNFSTEMKDLTRQIREGDGTLSKLINDDSLARKAEESFDKVGAAGDEIQTLLADKREELNNLVESLSEVGPKIEAAANDIQEFSKQLQESEGTLHLLINDPSLYQDAKRAVNQVSDSFEGSEEQGVIRSFVGVLFGALI